jgi:hypothetical protein
MICAPVYCRRFVGRIEELALVEARACDASAAAGSVVLIGGEAGIGKTRFLLETRLKLANRGIRYASGQCFEHAQVPLAPFTEILRDLDAADAQVLSGSRSLRSALGRLVPEDAAEDAVAASSPSSDVRGQFVAIAEALRRFAVRARASSPSKTHTGRTSRHSKRCSTLPHESARPVCSYW